MRRRKFDLSPGYGTAAFQPPIASCPLPSGREAVEGEECRFASQADPAGMSSPAVRSNSIRGMVEDKNLAERVF